VDGLLSAGNDQLLWSFSLFDYDTENRKFIQRQLFQ